MEKISKYDLKLFRQLAIMSEKNLLSSLPKVLGNYYSKDNIIANKHYIYVLGDIPVGLVAHLDTVHRTPVSNIYHDEKKCVLWSPQGLGADDRAGVFSILKILEDGYRPSILLCTKEEAGGIGAAKLVKNHPKPLVKTNFLIELDRRGIEDSVFYEYDNPIFEDYINSFGFSTNWGTFSDISIISPVWKIASVNLSIGYFNEHSLTEILCYNHMFSTIDKVKKILINANENPITFDYKEVSYQKSYFWSDFENKAIKTDHISCDCCGNVYHKNAMVKTFEDNEYVNLCPECVSYFVSWCSRCGKPFIGERVTDTVCQECQKNV